MLNIAEQDAIWLEGAISVTAALEAQSRDIYRILIRDNRDDRETRRIENLAEQFCIPVEKLPENEIAATASGTSHGGIIASAGPRKFVSAGDIIREGRDGWVVLIDGVEDPFNFGSSLRSLNAAGVSGLIVRPRNWFTAGNIVARASAGASERIPTAIVETIEEAAQIFHQNGFQIVCADEGPTSVSLYETNLTDPLLLIIGGEKRGITRSFKNVDAAIRIPYGNPVSHSLGTAASSAIIGFEIMRQRKVSLPSKTPAKDITPAPKTLPAPKTQKKIYKAQTTKPIPPRSKKRF